jgi:hypothetical protein
MKVLSSENKLNIDIIKSSKLLGLWSLFMIVIIIVYLTTETVVPKEFKYISFDDKGTDTLNYFYKVIVILLIPTHLFRSEVRFIINPSLSKRLLNL